MWVSAIGAKFTMNYFLSISCLIVLPACSLLISDKNEGVDAALLDDGGQRIDGSVQGPDGGGVVTDASAGCDPWSQDCPNFGEIPMQCRGRDPTGVCLVDMSSGTSTTCDLCGPADQSCPVGHGCQSSACVPLCDAAHPCAAGSCVPYSGPFGYCAGVC